MFRLDTFFFTIIQFLLLVGSTRQSRIKQAVTTLKTIGRTIKSPLFKQVGNTIKKPFVKIFGNTIKNSANVLHRNKGTIKNIASGIQGKYMRTRHNFGSMSIKYLADQGIKKFKYTTPQIARGGKQLVKTESKKAIQIRSAAQMNRKVFRSMLKIPAGYMHQKELRSLINMVSKSKSALPLLFAGAGLNRLTQTSLVESDEGKRIDTSNDEDPNVVWDTHPNGNLYGVDDGTNPGWEREGAPQPAGVEKEQWLMRKYFHDKNVKFAASQPPGSTEVKVDFSNVKVKTNKDKVPEVRIVYCNSDEGQKNADDAVKIIQHGYPKAKIDLQKDNWKSLEILIGVNGVDIWDYLHEEGKNFRADVNMMIRRVKDHAEPCG